MRKLIVGLAAFGTILAACASQSSTVAPPASGASCAVSSLNLYKAGQLTVATDSPVYSPWFKHNDPSNGLGYESAVAYAVAQQLGFSKDQVHWVVQHFGTSFAPGPKKFDFDINEISITPDRSKAVTFSNGYYNDAQALVAVKGTPIAAATTIPQLKPYVYGEELGSTSLTFTAQVIQPAHQPKILSLNAAKAALNAGLIDGVITDLPTADYYQYSIHNGTVVGRFEPTNPPEQFGLLFQKNDPLVGCVNQALSALTTNGTLANLQAKWLKGYAAYPLIK